MKQIITEMVTILRQGGIILYPTDTVWGLGCDATNPEAVAKIYEIKERSDSKSLVLLAQNLDMVARYIKEIPEMAIELVEVNDKPMTIVYPDALVGQYGLAPNTVAEDGSVGIRIPNMDFCNQLISRFGRPIVSTSANISGCETPKTFAEISSAIKDAADYIAPAELEKTSTKQASSIIKLEVDGLFTIIRK